ncbi:MAG: AgmX/PglI C-terminal domain-containing protein [Bdellovibrionales bacterium]
MKQLLFFRVYKNNELISVKQFQESQIIVGQSYENTLQLDAHGVSPVHSMVEEREGKYFICDLGSESGTFVNGKKILDSAIMSGDEITIGPFRVEFYVGVPKPKAPPPAFEKKSEAPTASVPPSVTAKPVTPTPQKPVEFSREGMGIDTQGVPLPSRPQNKNPTPSAPRVSQTTHGTYAPPSQVSEVYQIVKPEKGNVVEILVAWNERIIETKQFEDHGIVTVGSHPSNKIILPVFGSSHVKHPFLKIEALVTLLVTDSMTVEVTSENGKVVTQQDLRVQNRLIPGGAGSSLTLQQGEMAKVHFGGGVSVLVRYTSSGAKPITAPFFDLSSSELVGAIATLVASAILGLYLLVYAPNIKTEEIPQEEPPRKAQFIYKKRVEVTEEAAGNKEAPKEEKKAVDAAKGAASDAPRHNKPATEVKPTTANPGKDKGIKKGSAAKETKQKEAAAATPAPPAPKDVSKTGLLSVFGAKGTQAQLRQTDKGAGLVGGLGQTATGAGAEIGAGAGTVPGAGTKDIGKSGKGESTFGISGIQTKGRGGGVSGYGTGTLGEKGNATVIPGGDGEAFTGTIDREGIRRVVKANARQIQACYEKALNQDPGLHGKILLEWEIGDRGRVLSARVKSSTLNNSIVEQCMIGHLKTWRFPEPPADQVAVVAFPFVFMSQN